MASARAPRPRAHARHPPTARGARAAYRRAAASLTPPGACAGKKVVVAVKAGGDDPSINRALAAIIREAMSLDVPKDVIDRNIKRASESTTVSYTHLTLPTTPYV